MKHTFFFFIMALSLPMIMNAENSSEVNLSASDETSRREMNGYESGADHRHHVVRVGSESIEVSDDSIRSMIDLFYIDQFRHFQDPRAPYFLFMSKDANLAMGIGGVVRMRMWGDFDGAVPANGFVPYLMPAPRDPAQKSRLSATPAGTALFFKVIGRNSAIGNYLAYIECNFDGYNNVGFKLKKAYVTVNDLTVGYSSTTFSDPVANPPTIDGAGPNGEVNRSAVLVRWMHSPDKNWRIAAAMEIPESMVDADNVFTKSINDWSPDIIGFGQYEWDEGNQHLRLSGLMRMIPYRNLIEMKNKTKIGWALQLSSVFKVAKPVTIYATINGGQGYASYTNDLQIGNYDLLDLPNHKGEMYAPYSIGITAGLKYNFTDNLYSCLALGQMRFLPQHSVDGSQYKYGLYGAANIFWDINPRFQIGAEYLIGCRKNFDGQRGSANRINVLAQFAF